MSRRDDKGGEAKSVFVSDGYDVTNSIFRLFIATIARLIHSIRFNSLDINNPYMIKDTLPAKNLKVKRLSQKYLFLL